jgi:hypothetical protein
MNKLRCYSDLIQYSTFEDRLHYLELHGVVGEDTFGFDRYINQKFYKSPEWRRVRDFVIVRDNGCDLGVKGYDIGDRIIVHHMNPLTLDDISNSSDFLLNPEYLICVSKDTHDIIHYGFSSDRYSKSKEPVDRKPGDTKLW